MKSPTCSANGATTAFRVSCLCLIAACSTSGGQVDGANVGDSVATDASSPIDDAQRADQKDGMAVIEDAMPRTSVDAMVSRDAGPEDSGDPEDASTTHQVPTLEWPVRDDTATSTRTFYGDRKGKEVFSLKFNAAAKGEKRWIDARIYVDQYEHSSADPLMMVAVSTRCSDENGNRSSQNAIGFTQNVVRPDRLVLRPRFIFTANRAGEFRCSLLAQGGRPRPTGSYNQTKFSVASGSFLRASNPLHPAAAQSYAPTEPSHVLDDGEAYDAAPLMWTAPESVHFIRAFGSVKMTTCTSIGGSDDPYDDLPALCGLPSHELDRNARGTRVNASFVIAQFGEDGGYCRQTTLPASPEVLIDKDSHHEMVVRSAGKIEVDTAPGCTRRFRIKTYVKQLSGPSVIVHRQGTLSSVIPR